MSDVRTVNKEGKPEYIDWRAAFLRAEALLKAIDSLVMPDRKGHVRKDAIKKIQDLVMTRPWQ